MAKTTKTDTATASTTDDMAALRTEMAELRAGKLAAETELQGERRAKREAQLQNMTAQERAVVAEQDACDSRIAEAEGEAQSIEDQIATLADEPGHGREIAQLTRKLTQASNKIDSETAKKAYLAGQREKITGANKVAREAAPLEDAKKVADGTPLTAFGTKTQAWLLAHPEAFTSRRFMKDARRAAEDALEDGHADESPEYYAAVEEKLGLKTAPAADEAEEEGEEVETPQATRTIQTESYVPEKPQRPAAGPGAMSSVAPPTRQTPAGGGGGRQRAPTLTAEEREVALSLYSDKNMSDADKLVRYAAGKKFMKDRNNQHFRGNN